MHPRRREFFGALRGPGGDYQLRGRVHRWRWKPIYCVVEATPQKTGFGSASEAGLPGIRLIEMAVWVFALLVYSVSVQVNRLGGKLQVMTA